MPQTLSWDTVRAALAMATITACGGFSAISGSSVATAATMSKVALPEMRRYGYPDSLATGTIAAGGTLGILIPPSIVLAIYGVLTDTDIGRLFIAGVVPGVLAILMYLATVRIYLAVFQDRPAGAGARRLGRAHGFAEGRVGDHPPVRLRHRRHLWRHLHAVGSGRHGSGGRHHHLGRAWPPGLAQAVPVPAREHPGYRGHLHDPDRSDPVRLFPDHHPGAAEDCKTTCWRSTSAPTPRS